MSLHDNPSIEMSVACFAAKPAKQFAVRSQQWRRRRGEADRRGNGAGDGLLSLSVIMGRGEEVMGLGAMRRYL